MTLNAFLQKLELLFILNLPSIVHFKEIHVDFLFSHFIQILRVTSLR